MISRRDNPDGTTTFSGVEVTIPTSLAATHDVVAVRRPRKDDVIEINGHWEAVVEPPESVYPILAPRPTWKPPASLRPGEYRWTGEYLVGSGFSATWARRLLRDWTDPTHVGKWRVNEDGTADYLGDT